MIVVHSILLHYYYQYGVDQSGNNLWASSLFITFGKFIFLGPLMLFLMQMTKNFGDFSKYIANSATIQFLGNMSFTMYLGHFIVIITC
jgi:peptidoglycan/LPS O-acetylase OafA/YrhL